MASKDGTFSNNLIKQLTRTKKDFGGHVIKN